MSRFATSTRRFTHREPARPAPLSALHLGDAISGSSRPGSLPAARMSERLPPSDRPVGHGLLHAARALSGADPSARARIDGSSRRPAPRPPRYARRRPSRAAWRAVAAWRYAHQRSPPRRERLASEQDGVARHPPGEPAREAARAALAGVASDHRLIAALPARHPQPQRQVHVLQVHEVALVEAAHAQHGVPAVEGGARAGAPHLARARRSCRRRGGTCRAGSPRRRDRGSRRCRRAVPGSASVTILVATAAARG